MLTNPKPHIAQQNIVTREVVKDLWVISSFRFTFTYDHAPVWPQAVCNWSFLLSVVERWVWAPQVRVRPWGRKCIGIIPPDGLVWIWKRTVFRPEKNEPKLFVFIHSKPIKSSAGSAPALTGHHLRKPSRSLNHKRALGRHSVSVSRKRFHHLSCSVTKCADGANSHSLKQLSSSHNRAIRLQLTFTKFSANS